jgi:hypothetical protein
MVLQPHKLLAVEVNDGDDILDGACVSSVVRLGANPVEGADEPLALVLGGSLP